MIKKLKKGKYTSCKQKGKPNHCFCAQVWNPDGTSLARIDPTDHPIEASQTAAFFSYCLNLQQRYDIAHLEECVTTLTDIYSYCEEEGFVRRNTIEDLLTKIKK